MKSKLVFCIVLVQFFNLSAMDENNLNNDFNVNNQQTTNIQTPTDQTDPRIQMAGILQLINDADKLRNGADPEEILLNYDPITRNALFSKIKYWLRNHDTMDLMMRPIVVNACLFLEELFYKKLLAGNDPDSNGVLYLEISKLLSRFVLCLSVAADTLGYDFWPTLKRFRDKITIYIANHCSELFFASVSFGASLCFKIINTKLTGIEKNPNFQNLLLDWCYNKTQTNNNDREINSTSLISLSSFNLGNLGKIPENQIMPYTGDNSDQFTTPLLPIPWSVVKCIGAYPYNAGYLAFIAFGMFIVNMMLTLFSF